ncbi:peptide-methionine (S)-S-oxide reductase MsrA [Chryseobacterium sp. Ch-15]|uniref:Peptide methionine sulfoxide reductase MsrA n=2 Tax=Chryseobacterium muglaense TaxID=2893752 RepID=A0A9Q3UUF2_9FLAO|nr:peptide-methionine (S)-S-oxide reductase MsrA [Chryseobacterium muglaense]MBD3904339.1 peptide-methionine (S)-S-oxide reductase MsrA [Chryseobacterium muglaense]MCC9035344.1 peptide-methionine (S)-S-oxide reductase MsrA [Chryseobacterium muglaense]MCM2553991.1 peptide-methionine (S)-S-oxide reductase MsrA [Chryseobacterium muglaense]
MKNFFIILISFLGLIKVLKRKHLNKTINLKMDKNNFQQITFGGGCFWCVESCFNILKGVEFAISGYSGGHKDNPTYEEICTGETGHAEVVQITYDPAIISYEQLMDVFFFLHDPTQLNRQGNDIGTQYRSVIYYKDDAEKAKAEEAIKISQESGRWQGTYVTELAPFEKFWPAEQYHQGYYNENPTQPYCSAVVGPKIQKFKKYFAELGMLETDSQ